MTEQWKDLEEKVKNSTVSVNDFKKTYYELKEAFIRLQKLLEVAKETANPDKRQELYKLYKDISHQNVSEYMERLRGLGFGLSNDKNIKDAFDNMGFRIMELTRLGKRDEVLYSMMRIFTSAKRKFYEPLAESFKPVYSDGEFKVMIYAFLSGILGEKKAM